MADLGLPLPNCVTSWLPSLDSTPTELAIFMVKVIVTAMITYINYWLWILPMNRVRKNQKLEHLWVPKITI